MLKHQKQKLFTDQYSISKMENRLNILVHFVNLKNTLYLPIETAWQVRCVRKKNGASNK